MTFANTPAPAAPLSVTQAIHLAAQSVASVPTMTIVGEVSGFRGPNARSGHYYFQLKDKTSKIEVCLWKGRYDQVGDRLSLRDGLRVQMTGSFNVYEPWGKLSFVIDSVALEGEGDLLLRIARLKRKLAAEGLLDESRKRPIPDFCERVCVVTSLSGSVRHDVRRTLQRRNPFVRIEEVDCAVQGKDAPPSIVRALATAAASAPDCILLVRGGGGTEDLMCFNDESVCRAVASCPVPVVAAIGHEDDVTLAEEVADRRCSLPGAAAESVAPSLSEIVRSINDRQLRLVSVMGKLMSRPATEVAGSVRRLTQATGALLSERRVYVETLAASRSLASPETIVLDRRTQLMHSEQRLLDSLPRMIDRAGRGTGDLGSRLRAAGTRVCVPHGRVLERVGQSLDSRRVLGRFSDELAHLQRMLEAYSPLGVLDRGYAIVRDADGHVISSSLSVREGEGVSVLLGSGAFDAFVTDVRDEAGE